MNEYGWVAIWGAVSGSLSFFIWLVRYIRRPRLVITSHYVRNWEFQNNVIWHFANLQVACEKGLALGCEAKVIVLKHPDNVNLVHELREEGYGLHWADAPYSSRSTGADRVDIGSTSQRLDLAFTIPGQAGQCHIAMPIALYLLTKGRIAPQAVLKEGEYILKIKVSCTNGKGASSMVRLISPNDWQDLKLEEVRVKTKVRVRGKRLCFQKTYLSK